MRAFINANTGRDYTSVMAPPSTESYGNYKKEPTPTMVIRQNGEAWHRPFAVVYEPFEGDKTKGNVQSVEQILVKNNFKGLKIISEIAGKTISHYAIVLEGENETYINKKMGIKFKGRYAVLSFDESQKPLSLYIGQGQSLSLKKLKITSKNGQSGSAYIALKPGEIVQNLSPELKITLK